MSLRYKIFHDALPNGEAYVDDLSIVHFDGRVIRVVAADGAEVEFSVVFGLPPELEAEYASIGEDICAHEQSEARSTIASNGVEMVSMQCVFCGERLSNFLKKADWPAQRVPWDEGLREAIYTANHNKRALIKLKAIAFSQLNDVTRKGEYDAYLRSDEWRKKRKIVLERDGHVCQGCGANRATEVHHLTYQHIYHEFLFELTSLCAGCHDRIHSDEDNAK